MVSAQGQSCRTGTMNFLKGYLQVLALDIFLCISLNLFVFHRTHLIVDNLNFLKIIVHYLFNRPGVAGAVL